MTFIIGQRYTAEELFQLANRAMEGGARELAIHGAISEANARAFLVVAGVRQLLLASDVERAKNFLHALCDVADATKDHALNAAAMARLNSALMRMTQGLT